MEENFDFEKEKAQADYIKCASCGGNMVFDPESQMLSCEHCGSKVSFENEKAVEEINIEKAFEAVESWSDAMVLHCENCGADISMSREEVALECPYCGTSHVKRIETLEGVKPNAVFPFSFGGDEAKLVAKKWAKSRFFAPRKFKKNLDARDLKGIYQPCWTFDSSTSSTYKGRLGERRTRTIRTKNGVKTQTYIHWFNVSGTISNNFDDVTISASSKFEQDKLQRLMPFEYSKLTNYSKEYLAGFYANHYDKDVKSSWSEAKEYMDDQIKKTIVANYHADVVDYLNVSTIHSNVTYKYVLMPVYVLNYRYKKKDYAVNINGNTGKVFGKSPISFWRVLGVVLLCAAVLIGGYYLFMKGNSDSAQIINQIVNNKLLF